jgi:hypothetical protein
VDIIKTTCSYCGERPVKAGARTCGDSECRSMATRETRGSNELGNQLRYMRNAYGDDNPWTRWLRDAMRKQGEG